MAKGNSARLRHMAETLAYASLLVRLRHSSGPGLLLQHVLPIVVLCCIDRARERPGSGTVCSAAQSVGQTGPVFAN